ncbi:thioredoxin-like [Asterias rubens]|uniref:thioredoxin-like n=1 Tax=Asterias rubens TaxID=7604 RepID=UPI001455A7A3|nr:thioredoxin-like [Asterias rubens]
MSAKKITTGKAHVIESTAQFEEYKSGCGNMLLVVDFHAPWCGPCRSIGPAFEKIATETLDACFIKVDVDELEDVAALCEVSCMPTFHFYKNGSRLKVFSGANETTLKELVAEFK